MLTRQDGVADAEDSADIDDDRSILSPIPFPSPPAITDPSVPDYRAPRWRALRKPALVVLAAAVAVTVGLAFRNRPDQPGTADSDAVSSLGSASTVVLDDGTADDAPDGGIEAAPPTTDASSVSLAPPVTAIADPDDPTPTAPAGDAPSTDEPVATTAPTTAPTTASSTTEPANAAPVPAVIGVGGFELGPDAGANNTLRHETGSTMGAWEVGKTVYREDVGLHGRTPGSGHVLNIRRSGSVTRPVEGLVPGQRYELVIRAAHHVDAPARSVVAARVAVDGQTITIAPTTRSDEPYERHTLQFTASGSEATVTITGAQATEFCCGVVFDNLQIEPIG